MKITTKGQVTIPIEIREKFGFQPNTEVEFQIRGGTVRLMKANRKRTQQRGADIIRRLAGKGNVKLSTDQILALTRNYR
jgi:AbrB family looped-hinge helix DNA binding protein